MQTTSTAKNLEATRDSIRQAIEEVEWLLFDHQNEKLLAIRSKLYRDYSECL